MEKELIALPPFKTPVARIRAWDSNVDFKDEFELELEHVPVLQTDAIPQIRLARQKLKLNGRILEDEIGVGIPAAKFYKLYSDAYQLKTPGSTAKYVTALKVHFGAEADSEGNYELLPIFQPIIMYQAPQTGSATLNDFVITKEGKYNYYDGNKFEEYSNTNIALTLKQNYKDKVGIIRVGQGTPSAYSASRNDVEATVFPFQTIYTLIVDNLHPPTETCVYSFNSIREELAPLAHEYRHCVLLATMKEDIGITDFINKYANRSHLCPPCTIKLDL